MYDRPSQTHLEVKPTVFRHFLYFFYILTFAAGLPELNLAPLTFGHEVEASYTAQLGLSETIYLGHADHTVATTGEYENEYEY